VHWTSDGVAILVHDAILTPAEQTDAEHPMACQGGPYTVAETRWEVLRTQCRTVASMSKDGRRYPIPTLDAAMKAIAAVPGAQVVLEMKPERPTAKETADYLGVITKYGMAERTVSSSFFPDALTRIRARAERDQIDLRYLLMLRPNPGQNLPTPDELGGQNLWGVALRADIATPGNVAGLREKKLTVVVWTVNTEQQWNTARQAQADLVLTDRPDAYRAWLP
jgi:glycerophosphoryl diester phosphodiesterase